MGNNSELEFTETVCNEKEVYIQKVELQKN